MPTWIVEPRDPLIVRDGRPFGPNPGARATSLAFPFPSTTTGGVRTRAGLDTNGFFDVSRIPQVKQIEVRGPLLVELDAEAEIAQWLAPVPDDALLLDLETPGKHKAIRRRLAPVEPALPASTNLPSDLALVGLNPPDPRKPYPGPPQFWYWSVFERWLLGVADGEEVALATLGHGGPEQEGRMHVSILPEAQTAVEGFLFQTRGLEFTRTLEKGPGRLGTARRLALAMVADAVLTEGLAPLGGERRIMNWRQSKTSLPACPQAVSDRIVQTQACRVILLTPACFDQGFRPTWLLAAQDGVKPTLQAVAIQRAQVVSGWNFEQDRPKPTRRLAPAGAVFFLSLEGTETAIRQWVDSHWMQAVSDSEQDRRDGFGLAVLGAWDGTLQKMTEEK